MPSAEFDTAAAEVRKLKKKPGPDDLLKLYGLYKQVTVGDNDTAKPGYLDFEGKAKWNAWDAVKGTSQKDAEKSYIDHVDGLKKTHGD